jgi:dTDP-4-dehydrorhamnose 3,5-epimerase
MRFTKTPIHGAAIVDQEPIPDERGFFARAYCAEEFRAHGLEPAIAQVNTSFNRRRGTLRGMHYQVDPAEETKLIRCIRGAIWDVIIDMRPESDTYLTHFGVHLSAENRSALYVPAMCAHGFQTLADDTDVLYQVGDFYRPGHERGLAYDDPAFAIEWPLPVSVISDKDREWPAFAAQPMAVT